MRVSVVVCTHTLERYDDLTEAVASVREGTYDDVEVVVVSDGSAAVADRMRTDYGEAADVVVHELDDNRGLLAARNAGAAAAGGDVVAFLDDDAVADDRWLERIVAAYEEHDAVAVGGKMVPLWVDEEPWFLPEEFYWLVGVTHRGFGEGRDQPAEVRNTNGSNLSFRADVFAALGGFEEDVVGRKGDRNLQGGETELCARLRAEYDEGVRYVPDAEVAHKIYGYRTEPSWLLDRAFWQGFSKRGMETFVPESTGEEDAFLRQLLGEFLPARLTGLVRRPSVRAAGQVVALVGLTGAVGAGYLYGLLAWR